MNSSQSATSAEAQRLLDEDAQLLHSRLKERCSLPVARLVVKRFTDFESDDWTNEEQRDNALSDAFDWCSSREGRRILRVADQLYAGIENHKLFSVAKAICDAVGDRQLPAEVLERVKACCALLILDVDAEFHTILTEGEGDAAAVVREVLLELEAQNRSSVADVESLPSPLHGVVPRTTTTIAELMATRDEEKEEEEDGSNNAAEAAAAKTSSTAGIPSVSAEQILCNCVRHRLAAAGMTLDDRTLSDFVWRAVNDPAVLGSDPSNPVSSLYAFLGSSHSVEAMINQVVAEASLGGLLKRVQTAEPSVPAPEPKPEAKPAAKQPAEIKPVVAEPVGDEEEFVLPRVHFDSEEGTGGNLVGIVMERTKASRQECAHVLEAVNFDIEAAVAILRSADEPPAATASPADAHDDGSGWILTEAQAEALQYFRSTAMEESDNAMPKLAKRFRDCGFTDEQMVQTLRYMCTEAPITIQCNVDSLRMFLRTGVLPRGAVISTLMGPVCYPARVHSLLHDASNYGGDQDDLPMRATCVPARRAPARDWDTPSHQVLITLRGVHGRSTIVHKLPWPAIGPEAVRLGTMEHCAHVLEGYTDTQIRMLVSTAANLPFPGAQNGFVVPAAHDVFIHGRLTIENIERVRFRHQAEIDVELAGALQRHLIPTEGGSSSGTVPFMVVHPHSMPKNGKGKKGKRANRQPEHLSFASPAPNPGDAEDEMLRRAIQDSLDMMPGRLP